jgi:hypothetical protein
MYAVTRLAKIRPIVENSPYPVALLCSAFIFNRVFSRIVSTSPHLLFREMATSAKQTVPIDYVDSGSGQSYDHYFRRFRLNDVLAIFPK